MFSDIINFFKLIRDWRHKKDNSRIELIHAKVDTSICNYHQHEEVKQAFFLKRASKTPKTTSPIFDFSLYNHYEKPIVLVGINLFIKFFWAGLSGIPQANPIKPSVQYTFPIKYDKNDYSFQLTDPLQVDKQTAFRFQIELLLPNDEALERPCALWFELVFNDKKKINAPVILINTNNEKGKREIQISS